MADEAKKITIVGDQGCGKTNFFFWLTATNYKSFEFTDEKPFDTTTGGNFATLSIKDHCYEVWDTAPGDKTQYQSLVNYHISQSSFVLIVVSVEQCESILADSSLLEKYIKAIKNKPAMIVISKSDLGSSAKLQQHLNTKFTNLPIYACSAKLNQGIDAIRTAIIRRLSTSASETTWLFAHRGRTAPQVRDLGDSRYRDEKDKSKRCCPCFNY